MEAAQVLDPVDGIEGNRRDIDALQRLRIGQPVAVEERQCGIAAKPAQVARRAAADVDAALARGSPTEREPRSPARFKVGDRVRTSAAMPAGHTRLPVYARDKVGVVRLVHGVHVFPDVHSTGEEPPYREDPQWLYAVEFDGRELWGDDGDAGLTVLIDAWEPYLEPVNPQ